MKILCKSLNLLNKKVAFRKHFVRFSAFIGAAFALSGCISSTGPVLGDAKPILGTRGQIHFFGAAGSGRDHTVMPFEWNGSRYVLRGRPNDGDFTVHAYEGRDLIVQSTSTKGPQRTEYGLARRLAEGVYLLIAIDEDDADDATKAKFCTKAADASCRIATPEQLFVFARATADKTEDSGGIAVVVPNAR